VPLPERLAAQGQDHVEPGGDSTLMDGVDVGDLDRDEHTGRRPPERLRDGVVVALDDADLPLRRLRCLQLDVPAGVEDDLEVEQVRVEGPAGGDVVGTDRGEDARDHGNLVSQ
jgi:hypothetical protein